MNIRDLGLDGLRGFAISLMFLDHILLFLFFQPLDSYGRTLTRLAEPIFMFLLGYFLFSRSKRSVLFSFFYVAVAAVFSNVIFYSLFGKLDILGSILFVYLFYVILGKWFFISFLSLFLFPFDFTKGFLDYPLTLVLSEAALGYLFRVDKLTSSILSLLMIVVVGLFDATYLFTALFFLVSLSLYFVKETFNIRALVFLGQRPLFFYVIQFYILFFIYFIWFIIY